MSVKIQIPSKEELINKYNYGSTISSLARFYNVSNPTIRNWLNHYKIKRKSHKQACIEYSKNKSINIPSNISLCSW